MIKGIAPGSILQLMYIRNRMRTLGARTFFDLGAGQGNLSNMLLTMGMSGEGFDLGEEACAANSHLNAEFIEAKKYSVRMESFLKADIREARDVTISSMVIEHLSENEVDEYLSLCKRITKKEGHLVLVVPSSPKHWGIEDETAGHKRRYTRESLTELASRNGLEITHLAGLTYPLSNLVLPLSNHLVEKAERDLMQLDEQTRTIKSGKRSVQYKSEFPSAIGWMINEISLMPLYWLQLLSRDNANCLVLYAEVRNA